VLIISPLSHAASGSLVIPVHIKGGTIFTLNKAGIEPMGHTIQKEKIEVIYTVPTVLYRILDMELFKKNDLSSLKTIRYGAASISPSKLEMILEVFGPILVQGYGSTECWPSATILGRKDHGIENEEQRKKLSSVGRPFPGEELIICDDVGQELAAGQKGEIWIRGANTIQGYYKDPGKTRRNFSKNGFWKSGDIGYMDEEGYLYLCGRKKDMIISGGFNVYSLEVENCLNLHPAVKNDAVFGLADDEWGEKVCAEVVLREAQKMTQEQLIDHCKVHLAGYKVPKMIRFVDELPLSSAGKVLKRLIKDKYT
jgi:acyl-CoA synthetase (AMP-forming)/AMP-acid ligase II